MISGHALLLCVVITAVFTPLIRLRIKQLDNKPENIEEDNKAKEEFSSFCLPGEKINVICRGAYKGKYAALTNKRILLQTREGIIGVDYNTVTKVKLYDSAHRAFSAERCNSALIYADRKYRLYRASTNFDEIYECLYARFGNSKYL